jgi:hypothetical protein
MILIEALVTFVAFWLLLSHIPAKTMRRIVGHKGWFDVILHTTVIILFFGTFEGLMQAEAAAIMFSLFLRGYAYFAGYERLTRKGWVRHSGRLTGLRTLS